MEGPVTMNPNIAEQGRKGRANMAPPTSVMDPRSRDYERRSKETENFLIGADILAGALPFAPLAKGAVMAAGKYAGPELARGLENYMVKSGAVLPMDVWHGSPHRFPPTAKNPLGEFDPMKIGTGEGAQAYGHGLYLAEAPEVAKGYASKLATFDEKLFGPIMEKHNISGDIAPNMNNVDFAKSLLADYGNKLNAAEKKVLQDSVKSYLYKVDLPDEHIAKMLDWDKPLSQQSEAVQKAVQSSEHPMVKYWASKSAENPAYNGADLYMRMAGEKGDKVAAAAALRELGIPGIRYLDQGSRAGGAGTSNFVVFDPAHMNILERNGVTAASLRNVAPQDEALRLAQQRAALPVEQHGLGLPADNTPQQRADAMGFDRDVYHGTTMDFNKFAGRLPTYAAEEPRIADIYANATTRHMSLNRPINAGPNIMPLKLGGKELTISDLGEGGGGWLSDNLAKALGIPRTRTLINELPNYGIDRLKVTDMGDLGGVQTQHMIPVGSDNIRSRFAAFDPWRRNSALAAALGVAAPDLLAEEK